MKQDDVTITGIAEFPQGKSAWPSTMAFQEKLVLTALEDAGLSLSDVDVLFTVEPRSDPYLIHALALAERLKISPEYCWSYNSGGCVPMTMLDAAHGLLQAGRARNAVIVVADLPLTSVSRDKYVSHLAHAGPIHPEFEAPYDPPVPAMFALIANAYLQRYGLDRNALAEVALHNRRMAAKHPNAHMKKPMSRDDYLVSRPIAEPLHLLDCAPVSDGGGAIVLSRRPHSTNSKHRRIKLFGSGFSMSHMHLSSSGDLTEFSGGAALKRALRAANLEINAIDLALIYDCFTIAMLVNLEDMGFAKRGAASHAFSDGEFALDGSVPINPHGGLLSHGHPARAGGMGNLIEAVVQLRGDAGDRQVKGCAFALAHGMGGVFASHAASILGRLD